MMKKQGSSIFTSSTRLLQPGEETVIIIGEIFRENESSKTSTDMLNGVYGPLLIHKSFAQETKRLVVQNFFVCERAVADNL